MGPVALVGYMGSGKTTVGRLLARDLGRSLVDLDRAVVIDAGRTIPEIFEEGGEEWFRDLEHKALLSVLDGPRAAERVIACGGGVILRPANRELLRRAATIFLREETDTLYGRTRGAGRPLRGAGREEFARRYAERLPLYEEVADLTVDARGRRAEEIAEEVLSWLSER